MSGKPLEREFWLGGSLDMDGNWTWTDNSTWGEVELGVAMLKGAKTEGCLSSKFTFTEMAIPNVPTAGHWTVSDCKTPLPAIYKVCIGQTCLQRTCPYFVQMSLFSQHYVPSSVLHAVLHPYFVTYLGTYRCAHGGCRFRCCAGRGSGKYTWTCAR